jgi:hypothetical protein
VDGDAQPDDGTYTGTQENQKRDLVAGRPRRHWRVALLIGEWESTELFSAADYQSQMVDLFRRAGSATPAGS